MYVTTEYDYKLQTEVFKVNGDKGYSHTTDTILREVEARNTSHIEYFTATFSVDVVRDKGDSHVVIYDGDEALNVIVDEEAQSLIEWGLNTSKTTFSVQLSYGVEHNIYARYIGNRQGLPSKSQVISITEPVPDLYGTLIERTDDVTQYDADTSISIPVRFTTGSQLEEAEIKELDLYVDDEQIQTEEISISAHSDNGQGTFTLQNGLETGLHHIKIQFDGDEHNEAFVLEFDIGVGYNIEILDYNKIFIRTETPVTDYNVVKCRITDSFDNPVTGITARLMSYDNVTQYAIVTTDSDGVANFNELSNVPDDAIVTYTHNVTYQSEIIPVNTMDITNISMELYHNVIAENFTTTINVNVQEPNGEFTGRDMSNIPVRFSDGQGMEKTSYTNTYGIATIQYTGANRGTVNMTANVGRASTNETIEDVTQYWSTEEETINKDYGVVYKNFYELVNGFKFENANANSIALIGLGDGNEQLFSDWTLSFRVTSASKKLQLVLGNEWSVGKIEGYIAISQQKLNLKAGDTVTMSYINGEMTINTPYSNEVFTDSQMGNGYPCFGILAETAKSQLTFNKLKFRRL